MAIYIDEQKKLFTLSTNNTSYQMMADKYLVLNHLYYGENIGQEDMSYLLDYQDRGFPETLTRQEMRETILSIPDHRNTPPTVWAITGSTV